VQTAPPPILTLKQHNAPCLVHRINILEGDRMPLSKSDVNITRYSRRSMWQQ